MSETAPQLTATLASLISPNPTFPHGYTLQGSFRQAVDFTNYILYLPISSIGLTPFIGGVSVINMVTMQETATPTLDQMYEGTAFGETPGVPPSQVIYGIACGDNTDLYLLLSSNVTFHRLVRVDASAFKVTGEWFVANGAPPPYDNVGGTPQGVVKSTSLSTVLGFKSDGLSGAASAPFFVNGTSMALIGAGPVLAHNNGSNTLLIGQDSSSSSCNFITINTDSAGGTGNIDIWQTNITELGGGAQGITNTKTATINISSIFPPTPNLYPSGAQWDSQHGCLLLWLTNSSVPDGTPQWVLSVELNGTINWSTGPVATSSLNFAGQGFAASDIIMWGQQNLITVQSTDNGGIQFQGFVTPYNGGAFYQIFDSRHSWYFTFALGLVPIRYEFRPSPVVGPMPPQEQTCITRCDRVIMAHLYTFTSNAGVVSRYTDFDIDVTYNGNTWITNSLRFEGLRRKVGVGLSVDEQTLKVWASPEDQIFGGNFLQGAEEGLLDGAVIVRQRIVWEFQTGNVAVDISKSPICVFTLFTGYTAEIVKGGASHVEFKVKSALVKLDVNMPRNYWQPGCLWTLFSQPGCGLNKNNYTTQDSVAAATYNTINPTNGVPMPMGADGIPTFAQGRIVFTSGINEGLETLIDTNDATTLYLAYPLDNDPAVGDTFNYYPGCSKSFNTCSVKWNNQANFRGFDKVPPVMISI